MPKRKKYRRLKERVYKAHLQQTHYHELPGWVLVIPIDISIQLRGKDKAKDVGR